MKILIVDDSAMMRRMLESLLKKEGYETEAVVCGEDAVKQIVSGKTYDLITLDIEMTGIDGFETCRQLRVECHSSIPILFITASDSLEVRMKGLDAGAADFITKKFLETELADVVKKIVKPHRQMEGLKALIVDDSKTHAAVLAQTLGEHGVRTVIMDAAESAVEFISAQPGYFDIFMIDLVLPGMSGLDLTRKIRKNFGIVETPIIILSVRQDKDTQIELFKAGATDYILKPFIKEELISRIQSHLGATMLNRKLRQAIIELKDSNKLLNDSQGKLEKANSETKQLLHVLCHDLTNPFSSIISLLNTVDKDSFDEYKPHLLSAAQNGLEIIDLVRKIRAIEEKKLDLTLSPVKLKSVVEESLLMLRNLFKQKNVTVNMNISPDITVMIEPVSFINSVMNNILTNAVKFSFPGSSIEITAGIFSGEVILIVKDRGIGMPHKILDNIFSMEKVTSREGTSGETGTGFGMPLVKKFLTSYKGSIEISSSDIKTSPSDHGTKVKIRLKPGSTV